ncbi:MAG: hypothetical protein EBZ78_05240 [Verrucomicrobia bacterium]|nr:hypothetical protein [Verrucomicrobiota bacterium]
MGSVLASEGGERRDHGAPRAAVQGQEMNAARSRPTQLQAVRTSAPGQPQARRRERIRRRAARGSGPKCRGSHTPEALRAARMATGTYSKGATRMLRLYSPDKQYRQRMGRRARVMVYSFGDMMKAVTAATHSGQSSPNRMRSRVVGHAKSSHPAGREGRAVSSKMPECWVEVAVNPQRRQVWAAVTV